MNQQILAVNEIFTQEEGIAFDLFDEQWREQFVMILQDRIKEQCNIISEQLDEQTTLGCVPYAYKKREFIERKTYLHPEGIVFVVRVKSRMNEQKNPLRFVPQCLDVMLFGTGNLEVHRKYLFEMMYETFKGLINSNSNKNVNYS